MMCFQDTFNMSVTTPSICKSKYFYQFELEPKQILNTVLSFIKALQIALLLLCVKCGVLFPISFNGHKFVLQRTNGIFCGILQQVCSFILTLIKCTLLHWSCYKKMSFSIG